MIGCGKTRRAAWLFGMVGALLGSAAYGQPDSVHGRGAVFTASNAADGNDLLMFSRDRDGTISPSAAVATGGDGTGTGLGNQGGLITAFGGRVVYVVNAGSGTISVFLAGHHGPALVQVADAGGDRPVSLTQHGRILYVLNADGDGAGADHINGFIIGGSGRLTAIPNSERPLSAPMTGPAQIGFTPDGSALVVTEKMTNQIDVYRVNHRGQAGQAMTQPSAGMTPFGFAFTRQGVLIVSEAFGGAPDASAVSSYLVRRNGSLQTISASVPTGETAACWIATTVNSRFAYTTNTGSASVSGYRVSHGALTPLTPGDPTASTGVGPIDAVVVGNRFLYVLAGNSAEINSFTIARDGALTPLETTGGLPPFANGLAAE